jgi:hypothetical protein
MRIVSVNTGNRMRLARNADEKCTVKNVIENPEQKDHTGGLDVDKMARQCEIDTCGSEWWNPVNIFI